MTPFSEPHCPSTSCCCPTWEVVFCCSLSYVPSQDRDACLLTSAVPVPGSWELSCVKWLPVWKLKEKEYKKGLGDIRLPWVEAEKNSALGNFVIQSHQKFFTVLFAIVLSRCPVCSTLNCHFITTSTHAKNLQYISMSNSLYLQRSKVPVPAFSFNEYSVSNYYVQGTISLGSPLETHRKK